MKARIPPELSDYLRIVSVSQGYKNVLEDHKRGFTADVPVQRLLVLFQDLRRRQVELQALRSIAGVSALARRIENDSAYSLTADMQALNQLINKVKADARALIPLNPDGTVVEKKFNAEDKYDFPSVAVADLTDLILSVDAAIADIET